MSDTSEAPSLASHVRRVRVPSQASDVDQFLDELFMPVLDGNLDELSDARSLAASIKGMRNANDKQHECTDNFINSLINGLFFNIYIFMMVVINFLPSNHSLNHSRKLVE